MAKYPTVEQAIARAEKRLREIDWEVNELLIERERVVQEIEGLQLAQAKAAAGVDAALRGTTEEQ